ncbi:MAG: thioredoxin domain-containing protein [Microgenomates group bacterium]
MKLTSETKLFLGIFAITGIILTIAMIVMTQPAKPVSKEILTANAMRTLGSKDAPVWLVEFSDYQCPACGQFYPSVKQLTEKYKDSLYFVYRNYPIPSHTMALPAARAAEAAALQGKYWEMHDALFLGQKELNTTFIASEAARLGLRMEAFNQDMQADAIQSLIDQDVRLGESIGVNATPTFYLNGNKLQLNTVNDLIVAVDAAITSTK